MTLVFDTETSNFPSASLPANHPDQARIVQLAWLLLDDALEEVGCFNSLIRIPEGVRISEGAAKAHGISEEMCRKYGIPIDYVIPSFLHAKGISTTVVAHNNTFDIQMINIEIDLLNTYEVKEWSNTFCTMRTMTPICKLPHKSRRGFGSQYKWPTLQEAHAHAFGNQFDGAHDALADVRATAKLYKWLMNRERQLQCPPLTTLNT